VNFGTAIVETRKLGIDKIIERHYQYLPRDWPCVVFGYHDKPSYDFCEFIQLQSPIMNYNSYNRLLTSLWFWNKLDFDKVLIFQHDSGLLRHGIEEFYGWDYVGAPWVWQEPKFGGNGGLSWRSVHAMREILRKKKYTSAHGYEDVYFVNSMREYNMNVAPYEVCRKFSVETIFELGTLGYHNIENWLTPQQCKKILKQYQ